MSARRWAIVLITLTLALTTSSSAALGQADGDCHYDPVLKGMVCGEGGDAGDPGTPPEYLWDSWAASGYCALPSETSILWERHLWRVADHVPVETQVTCVEPDWEEVWNEIAEVAAAIGVPQFDVAPPDHFGAVVGSPMLLWYSGQSQIQPITATVTDPTGVVYSVEGRGWIEQITWDMGDGSEVTSTYRDGFDTATFYGDFDNPEAQHTYEHTSDSQGYPIDPDRCGLAFTPVSVTLTWTGEYRTVEGILQTTWTPVPANLDITETFEIPVREIRSALISEDSQLEDDECTWS